MSYCVFFQKNYFALWLYLLWKTFFKVFLLPSVPNDQRSRKIFIDFISLFSCRWKIVFLCWYFLNLVSLVFSYTSWDFIIVRNVTADVARLSNAFSVKGVITKMHLERYLLVAWGVLSCDCNRKMIVCYFSPDEKHLYIFFQLGKITLFVRSFVRFFFLHYLGWILDWYLGSVFATRKRGLHRICLPRIVQKRVRNWKNFYDCVGLVINTYNDVIFPNFKSFKSRCKSDVWLCKYNVLYAELREET